MSVGDRFATIIKDLVKEIKKLESSSSRAGGETNG